MWAVAAVTGTGALLAMLDSTLVNLALATIRDDLGAPLATVQWVVTAYLVALTVSLPAQAWLGRRFGYGRVWAASLCGFLVASLLCALAPGAWWLVAARVAQGLAAGVLVPAGQAVIGATARPTQLGRLMGVLGLVIALGPAVGPAVGGAVLEVASWRWLFGLNLPIGLAALVAARGLVPPGDRRPREPLDLRGLLLLGSGLPLILYGATAIGERGLSSARLLPVVAGAALVASAVRGGTHDRSRLIDLSVLRRAPVAPATVTNLLTGANLYGGLLLLPLWLQGAVGVGTARTGVLLLAMGLGSAGALYVAGTLTDRLGPRPLVVTGAGLLLATTVPFVLPGAPTGAWLTTLLVVRGAGLAFAQMPALTAAYASVTAAEMGDATTLVNIAQRVGGAVGAVGVVAVLGPADSQAFGRGFVVLLLTGAATLLTGARLSPVRPRPTTDPRTTAGGERATRSA